MSDIIIAEEIQRIQNGVTAALNACATKGVTVTGHKLDNLANDILSIQTGGGGITPTGNINITTTNTVDVTNYATAKVSDSNLVSANIITGKSILGIQGSAVVPSGNINITNTNSTNVTNYATAKIVDSNLVSSNIITGKTILGIAGSAVVPSGNINITNTNSTNVTNYATAKIVDANLTADNIIRGKTILGIQGKAITDTGPFKKRITCVVTNGDHYYNTGLLPKSTWCYHGKLRFDELGTNLGVFGCRTGTTTAALKTAVYVYTNSANQLYYQKYGSSGTTGANANTGIRSISAGEIKLVVNDGSTNQTITVTDTAASSTNASYPLYLLSISTPSYNYPIFKGALYNFTIIDSDTGGYIADYIPVLDNNNKACLYDKVGGTLLYHTGSGDMAYEE